MKPQDVKIGNWVSVTLTAQIKEIYANRVTLDTDKAGVYLCQVPIGCVELVSSVE